MAMEFKIKDCTLITRMVGISTAMSLRELQERVAICPQESLFHHFCETVIRPTFDDPEFRNDFAIWASRILRDRVLAERLGILNPYSMSDFEKLRREVLDIIDERLSELPTVLWAPRGEEFRFMRAVTVVFDTGKQFASPADLIREIPDMSLGSIYYHFVEARRRTKDRIDDFSAWLLENVEGSGLFCEALSKIDFYFLGLKELKQVLMRTTTAVGTDMNYLPTSAEVSHE
jgi:hypothetical protein